MNDLTGWAPHDGEGTPPALAQTDTDETWTSPVVRVLLRGRPETGPKEAGPSPASAFSWVWHAGTPRADMPNVFVATNAMFAAGDVIAWRLDNDPSPFASYPHVRADIGGGR